MSKYYILFFIIFISVYIRANDSSYAGTGNQLIPLVESDIRVKKEILSITRSKTDEHTVDVSVYYEFYNPGKAKTLTIGFEAFSPDGDADVTPHREGQPSISNFTIDVNGTKIPYNVSIVTDSIYYQKGIINALTNKDIDKIIDDEQYNYYFYVYHFNTTFKTGINIVKHTYTHELSGGVAYNWNFDYVLSAAMRWGNKQIDDFTLNIDMGKDQLICITPDFYNDLSEWTIDGIGRTGKLVNMNKFYWTDNNTEAFFIKEGKLIFQKKNFKPAGELHLYSPRAINNFDCFDYEIDLELPYNINYYIKDIIPADEVSKKILRNLPFAYKGYVFTNAELQKYFEKQLWYYPDYGYTPDISKLDEDEREWVDYWSNYNLDRLERETLNEVFDYQQNTHISYYTYLNTKQVLRPANEISKKILRNLPFAYRGYVFANQTLQTYFERQQWYSPNSSYKAELDGLTSKEKQWVNSWSE